LPERGVEVHLAEQPL